MEAHFDADYVFRLHRGLLPRNRFPEAGAETSERTEVLGANAYLITSADDCESWFYHIEVLTKAARTPFQVVIENLSYMDDWWRWTLSRENMESLQAAGYECSKNGAFLKSLEAALEHVLRHGCSQSDGVSDDAPF